MALQLCSYIYLVLPWLFSTHHWGFRLDWAAIDGYHFTAVGFGVWIVGAILRLRADGPAPRHIALLILAAIGTVVTMTGPDVLYGAVLFSTWGLAFTDLYLTERRLGRFPRLTLGTIAGALTVLLLFAAPTGYSYYAPSHFLMMGRITQVTGGHPGGHILGLSVVNESAPPAVWLLARFAPQVDLIVQNTQEGYAEARTTLLQQARVQGDLVAPAVAQAYLGLGSGATPSGEGVLVEWVILDGPAAGRVQAGDLLATFNGEQIRDTAQFTQLVRALHPGDTVQFALKRNGTVVETAVTLAGRPDDPTVGYIGVHLADDLRFDIPVPVTIQDRGVIGSSWSGVLALEIINQLTPGGITNGNVVAGTGTLGPDGSINPVGGVPQKVWLAEEAGANVVFVPATQAAEAAKGARQIQIVPVTTLADMVDWLKAHPRL